jgi:hypothetical protein
MRGSIVPGATDEDRSSTQEKLLEPTTVASQSQLVPVGVAVTVTVLARVTATVTG